MIPLTEWMRQHHGVAHSSTVRLAGYDAHAVRTAIASGAITRVRRSWLVDVECSDERRQAA
ncbi:type IV toxin-antitoxin system AbiEi family antitoxin domain-containing protein [Microbacterium croceum]|uniref:type IV toxin-antitoxin system AbiEi family antitoxin domain-containing protein n=1 Tax=Microbacterium croceum TaxID=2851645 RepID=UPI001FFC5F02|nr:type IV toxin-antitoxin system AbiEi family antitoxin domain-containing protein [Microbacterium croceum]